MAEDIVARARGYADHIGSVVALGNMAYAGNADIQLLRELADEIERLRAEARKWELFAEERIKDVNRANEALERTRASLSRAEEWRGEVVAALASFGFNSLGEPTFEAGYPDIRKLISLRDRGASLAGDGSLETKP